VATASLPREQGLDEALRDLLWPVRATPIERYVRVAIVAAWVALAVHDLGPPHHHSLPGELPGWSVMTLAMMGIAALPAVRYVSMSSLRWRRTRAVCEFGIVYLGTWVLVGGAAYGALWLLGPTRNRELLVVITLVVAAIWQLTPQKRRALRDCHRAVPLPPTGTRATAGCVAFGWTHARACVASCWALMTIMVVATTAHLLWCGVVTAIVLHERWAIRPRRATRETAAVLCAGACVVALVAVAL